VDLALFVIILATLIVGHEFGHFVAARLSGVRVDEFGIGFPPRLATLFTSGGTRFTLNWIPLGGFVRPAGEDDPNVPGGLAAAPKRVRTFVLLSGPGANILLAILAFTAAYKFAAPDNDRVLFTTIAPGSPAAEAGILPGDIVQTVDGISIHGYETLQAAIAERLGQEIVLVLDRQGELVEVRLTPRQNPPEGQGPMGVVTGNPTRGVSWGEAAQAGLQSVQIQFSELIRLPGRLARGEVAPEEARVSGLKGMYDMISWAGEIDRSTQRPFLTLNLIGVISAGLALANLLPIPALDGGRLMFVLIEIVLGRRLSPRHEGLAHAIGFALLLALMVYVNLQDFLHPIALPR
jgi:regulator of sigma E protease